MVHGGEKCRRKKKDYPFGELRQMRGLSELKGNDFARAADTSNHAVDSILKRELPTAGTRKRRKEGSGSELRSWRACLDIKVLPQKDVHQKPPAIQQRVRVMKSACVAPLALPSPGLECFL
jgi:hypothetical protein